MALFTINLGGGGVGQAQPPKRPLSAHWVLLSLAPLLMLASVFGSLSGVIAGGLMIVAFFYALSRILPWLAYQAGYWIGYRMTAGAPGAVAPSYPPAYPSHAVYPPQAQTPPPPPPEPAYQPTPGYDWPPRGQ